MSLDSPGLAFRAALSKETPLQIVGTINANHALLAQRAGYQAIYLSGGGVAAGSLGLPDLGISTPMTFSPTFAALLTSARCRCWWMPTSDLARLRLTSHEP